MSGGSYDYLASWKSLDEQRGNIERMAVRMEGLPWAAQAAAATRRILALMNEANRIAESLDDAWHAIEWWDSCDWGEDQAREDVEGYTRPDGQTVPDVLYRLVDAGEGVVELRPVHGASPATDHEAPATCSHNTAAANQPPEYCEQPTAEDSEYCHAHQYTTGEADNSDEDYWDD